MAERSRVTEVRYSWIIWGASVPDTLVWHGDGGGVERVYGRRRVLWRESHPGSGSRLEDRDTRNFLSWLSEAIKSCIARKGKESSEAAKSACMLDLALRATYRRRVLCEASYSPRGQGGRHDRPGSRAFLPGTPRRLRARQGSPARIPCSPRSRRPRRAHPPTEAGPLPNDAPHSLGDLRR